MKNSALRLAHACKIFLLPPFHTDIFSRRTRRPSPQQSLTKPRGPINNHSTHLIFQYGMPFLKFQLQQYRKSVPMPDSKQSLLQLSCLRHTSVNVQHSFDYLTSQSRESLRMSYFCRGSSMLQCLPDSSHGTRNISIIIILEPKNFVVRKHKRFCQSHIARRKVHCLIFVFFIHPAATRDTMSLQTHLTMLSFSLPKLLI